MSLENYENQSGKSLRDNIISEQNDKITEQMNNKSELTVFTFQNPMNNPKSTLGEPVNSTIQTITKTVCGSRG